MALLTSVCDTVTRVQQGGKSLQNFCLHSRRAADSQMPVLLARHVNIAQAVVKPWQRGWPIPTVRWHAGAQRISWYPTTAAHRAHCEAV